MRQGSTELVRRPDGWYVVGFACGELGPYASQEEASERREDARRWYRTEYRAKQRTLFSGLDCLPGQADLFDDLDRV